MSKAGFEDSRITVGLDLCVEPIGGRSETTAPTIS